MSTIQRIAKNTLVLLISNIIGLFLSFFYLMYTARYLGPDSYGVLTFALAFTAITNFFTDLGLISVIVRDVARDTTQARKYMGNVALIKIGLAVFTFVVTAIAINLLDYPAQTRSVIYVITLSVIVNAFAGIFNSMFQSFEKMEYVSLGFIINNSILLAGSIFAISKGLDVLSFAFIYLIASLVVLVINIVITKLKFILPRLEIKISFWRYLLGEAMAFGLSAIFVRIYYYIDTFMISLMISDPNMIMGWYNAAYRLVLILSFIPSNFLGALYPIMSRCYISSDKTIQFMFERSFKYMFMLALPIGVGTTMLADRIIYFVYGIEFAPSIIALEILIWSEVLIFINVVLGNLFNSINEQMVVAKQTVFAAALNIGLNLILIPRYSYVGASVSTVITEFFVFLFLFALAYRGKYRMSDDIGVNLLKVIFASLLMACFIWLLGGLDLFPLIFISTTIYLLAIYLSKVVDEIDLQMFKQLVGELSFKRHF